MAASVQELVQTIYTKPPAALAGPAQRLASRLVPDGTPVWVPVRPEASARMHECFYNVRSHVKEHGGSLVYGWALWEWPEVFVETEHHAVWEKDGELIDVTPHDVRVDRIAFLPDPSATFDWSNLTQRENVRMPIRDTTAVRAYLSVVEEMREWMRANSKGRMMSLDVATRDRFVQRTLQAKLDVFSELAAKRGGNAKCICGSGLKFKRCCGHLFR